MKIHVFGFRIETNDLPPAMNATDGFVALQSNAGKPLDKKELIRGGATTIPNRFDGKNEEWWGGLVLRARDAKSFNQLVTDNGKLKLTAHHLGDGKIAELCYCLAHPTTGHGLIAAYHTGPSLPTLGWVLKRLFGNVVKERRSAGIKAADKDRIKKQEIIEGFKGDFKLSQLMRGGSLKEILKELKRVTAVEVTYSTVTMSGGRLFKKLKAQACSETEKLVFPTDFIFDDTLADELIKDMCDSNVTDAAIEGPDTTGQKRRFSCDMLRNKLLFAEEEYDNLLGSLDLDLSDWDTHIRQSPVISFMQKLINKPENRLLLGT